MAQISIEIEEYKELLKVKISKEYEEEIQNLKLEIQEKEANQNYWYTEWSREHREKNDLKKKLDELTKGEDTDAS